MRIDPLTEMLITLKEARGRLRRNRGRPPAPSTMTRWVHDGCTAVDGRRVRLETVRIGGRIMTTVEALHRFLDDLNRPAPADDGDGENGDGGPQGRPPRLAEALRNERLLDTE